MVIGYLFLPSRVAAGAGGDMPGEEVGTLLANFEKLILQSSDSGAGYRDETLREKRRTSAAEWLAEVCGLHFIQVKRVVVVTITKKSTVEDKPRL
ncbi:unnamed protein product [Merluccius merluccius]